MQPTPTNKKCTKALRLAAVRARAMDGKGLRGGKRREANLFFERQLPPRGRIMGIPAAFQEFPPPTFQPVGAASVR